MRKILFRGKRVDNGEWVISDCFYQCDGEIKLWDNPNRDGWVNVKHETIGQYTGLKDKNDTKIFEGDILTNNCCNRQCNYHIQGYVGFNEKWGYVLKYNIEDDGHTNWRFDADKTLEIIGNIYDNPELLNE